MSSIVPNSDVDAYCAKNRTRDVRQAAKDYDAKHVVIAAKVLDMHRDYPTIYNLNKPKLALSTPQTGEPGGENEF